MARATVAQKEFIFNHLKHHPSPEQLAVHSDPHRVRLVTGGERAGKSCLSGMELVGNVPEAMKQPGGALFWLVAKDYDLCRADFQYVIDALLKIGIVKSHHVSAPRVGPWSILRKDQFDRNLLEITSHSLQDIAKIASYAPDGILICEAGQVPWDAIPRILARTAEKSAWTLMSGTMETSLGWFAEKHAFYQNENRGPGIADIVDSETFP